LNEKLSRRESIADALGVGRGDHPSYEMLEQFVDGTADDVMREIIDSHRQVCTNCDAELRDLMSFSGRARGSTALYRLGAAVAAIALIIAGAVFLRRATTTKKPVRDLPTRTTIASTYGREDWDAAVRTTLARGAIERPAILADLRPSADVLRTPNTPDTRPTMSPVGAVIEETAPLLTWPVARGRFVVSVFDGFKRVARSGVLRSAEWRVSPPLARGRTYTWQVEIRRGDSVELLPSPPAPAALFHVLDESDAAELAEARRRFPNDHLLLGVLYARAGMQQEAVGELREHHGHIAASVEHW